MYGELVGGRPPAERRSRAKGGGPAARFLTDVERGDRSWMVLAACRGTGPEQFFPPEDPDYPRRTAPPAVCGGCQVRPDCLEYGMHERHGWWGGVSSGTREKMRSERRRAPTGAST